MNIFQDYKNKIETILQNLKQEGAISSADFSKISVEPPKDFSFGHLTTNAAMVLAKVESTSPRVLAEKILPHILKLDGITSASIAGAGFINVTLDRSVLSQVILSILSSKDSFGSSQLGANKKINVEYVSGNPTGPLHAGHGRGAVVGDAIANLLIKIGFDVQKEYYINDSGGQAETLARSSYLRYKEALGQNIGEIPEGYYPGDYLKDVGQALAEKYGASLLEKSENLWLDDIMVFAVDFLMNEIKEDLKTLGIQDMLFSSEAALVKKGAVEEAILSLENKNLIYKGVLEAPKGIKAEDWEAKPQLIFKATEFGDDVDRPLQRSDGSWTYFAKDIAYHFDKFQRGFTEQINVWGADHGGYVKRMTSALSAISDKQATLDVKLCQMVNFTENGEPVKMSKRAGTFITLKDVLESVGKDVLRFTMLTRKSDAQLDFDYTKVKEQSKDNPVFYVQYAHARCYSVMNQALEAFPDLEFATKIEDLEYLSRDEDQIMWFMGQYPLNIQQAALLKEPHRIVYYLYDLASLFHSLWTKGKDDAELRFVLPQNKDKTFARISLIKGLQLILDNGLNLLGVTPLKEMR